MDTPPRLREPCPEIATHEGSPGHGAALCLQQGDGVAPIHPPRAPARSCPPVFPAEFTGRLKRLKGTKTHSLFQLEFSSQKSSWACTEGICRNSYCFVQAQAMPLSPSRALLGCSEQDPTSPALVALLGLSWSWGLGIAAWGEISSMQSPGGMDGFPGLPASSAVPTERCSPFRANNPLP